jgi:hypothetical protein
VPAQTQAAPSLIPTSHSRSRTLVCTVERRSVVARGRRIPLSQERLLCLSLLEPRACVAPSFFRATSRLAADEQRRCAISCAPFHCPTLRERPRFEPTPIRFSPVIPNDSHVLSSANSKRPRTTSSCDSPRLNSSPNRLSKLLRRKFSFENLRARFSYVPTAGACRGSKWNRPAGSRGGNWTPGFWRLSPPGFYQAEMPINSMSRRECLGGSRSRDGPSFQHADRRRIPGPIASLP